ncbi:MAG: hypothetical protein AAFX99_08445 [Myxococcota bacterium]
MRYDDPSGDDLEFVELFGQPATPLDGLALVHINGSNDQELWRIPLDGVTLPADGYLVLGDAAVLNVDLDWSSQPGITGGNTSDLQNGAEALRLVNTDTGQEIDALGWGNADNFMGEGQPALELNTANDNISLARIPNGADIGDNSIDFAAAVAPTPGAPNSIAQPEGLERLSAEALDGSTYPLTIAAGDTVALTLTHPNSLVGTLAALDIGLLTDATDQPVELLFSDPADSLLLALVDSAQPAQPIWIFDLVDPSIDDLNALDGLVLTADSGDWTLLFSNAGSTPITVHDWFLLLTFD